MPATLKVISALSMPIGRIKKPIYAACAVEFATQHLHPLPSIAMYSTRFAKIKSNQEKELYHVVYHGYCNHYRDCRCRYCRVAHPTVTSLQFLTPNHFLS
nr:MAG TPA: hypothetical protein [Caudoviricetes sp.]